MKPYFIFNNVKSTDYLIINTLPSCFKALRDIQKIEVIGRSGYLTQDLGSYRGVLKSVACTIRNLDDIGFLNQWLDGGGEVIFSNEPEKKYYATIISEIDYVKFVKEYKSFTIIFDCQPFGYDLFCDSTLLSITKTTNVYNGFTYFSEPVLKVYGEGNITLTIGNQVITLTNVVDYVTIDTPLQNCYKDASLQNNNMSGDFPVLNVGSNNISWTGNITKIEITKNFRSL
ncbi:MAG TPA: distal tail protein Dit [Clostridium sp.]